MTNRLLGIDLGTSTLKIYRKGHEIVFDEKNVIAIENKKKIIAIGDEAYEMLEKAPRNINVSYPVRNGVIAEIANMETLINSTFKKILRNNYKGGYCIIAVPTDITEVEKMAFRDLIAHSCIKAKSVGIVEKPIAAALGAGLDITCASGVMTVDMGADTTEISIMSLGGIVISKLIPIGGNRLDDSIRLYVKKKYNLIIGHKTAEHIKKELADAFNTEERSINVFGRNVVTGLPSEMEINSSMVHEAIIEYLNTIIDNIKMILERTPPEISSDIIDSGIYILGGSANISNLDQLISRETELKVNVCPNPSNAVINGLGSIIDDSNLKTLTSIMSSGTSRRK